MTQKKVLHIEGMSCANCKKHVEEALNGMDGVTAQVDLDSKTAHVTDAGNTMDETFRTVIDDAGYDLTSIEAV